MLVVLVFLILLIFKNPFEPTHPQTFNEGEANEFTIYPKDYPGGHGMNPMLRNPWMVIHPPILFIGYALITIPFAAGLGYSITGDKSWTKSSIQWSRLAWLFLSLGIGIGAVWAYIALGWGGYWAWDPVEVAGLIPWITLSAFLHTQLMNKRKNEYKIITPLLGTFTFLLVLFATFITRSGLWTSVHAWSETEVGQILGGTMIITFVLSLVIILFSFFKRGDMPTFGLASDEEQIENQEKRKYNWDSITMLATVIIFAVLTIVTLIVLMSTMGKFTPEAYETRLTPFVIILMIIMSICLCWRYFGFYRCTFSRIQLNHFMLVQSMTLILLGSLTLILLASWYHLRCF
jgi:cytochrome c biogenesis factor